MRDIRIWALAIMMGGVLGLAGGFAASFATSQGGGISLGEVVPSSEAGLLPSPSSSLDGEFSYPSYQSGSGGSAGVRTSYEGSATSSLSTASGMNSLDRSTGAPISTSSSTSLSTVGERSSALLNLSSSVALVGQGALAPAAGPGTTAVQWGRDVLSTVQLISDVNHDGKVDVEDLALVGAAFGTSLLEFDLNGDGVVDHEDLDVVVRDLVR